MGHSCRKLLWDTLVGRSCRTLLWVTLVGNSCGTLLWDTLPAFEILRVLKLYSSQLPAPQIAPRTKVVLLSRQFSASSSTDCSAYLVTKVVLPSHQFSSSSSPDTPRTKVVLHSHQCSPAFRALDTHDLCTGLRGHRTNRTLACISRTRHARSPQRAVWAPDKSHSRLHFARFCALDTHDLRRGLRAHGTNRTLACISHIHHARSPQKVARQVSKTSVSYETSSKTHTSKSAKRAFRTRLPPKVKRKPSEHTHHAALPRSFASPAPPNNIRSHANPNATATFTSTTTHNLTIPCACHESFRVHTSNAHKVLRLP